MPLERDHARRSPALLIRRQVEALDAWNEARHKRTHELTAPASRGGTLDTARLLGSLTHAHQTVLERTAACLAAAGGPLRAALPLRAVVAHRHRWFSDKITAALGSQGIVVVGVTGNGAEAVGLTVAEQPDLLITGEPLAMFSSAELLGQAALFAPGTLRAAQAVDSASVGLLLDAGAQTVFTGQVPPGNMAHDLRQLLRHST